MTRPKSPKRVILAVDLRGEDPKQIKKIYHLLISTIGCKTDAVEPVTVLNQEDAAIGYLIKNRIGKLRQAAERHFSELLEQQGLNSLREPKVLFSKGTSTSGAVATLVEYAKSTGCELIALTTHARRGIDRVFLGSFAETLSLHSPIPLFIVNPSYRARLKRLQTVLYPTDFSSPCEEGLGRLCQELTGRAAQIILFHQVILPLHVYPQPFVTLPLSPVTLGEEYAKKMEIGQEWKKKIEARGIKAKLIIHKKPTPPTDAILSAAAKEKAGWIAMVSQTGKMGTLLFGSVTRQVLRESKLPLWVIHPGPSTKTKKHPKPKLRVAGPAYPYVSSAR